MRLNRCLDGIVCGAVVLLNAAAAGAVPSSNEGPGLEALRRVASEKGYDITEAVMTSGCLAVSYVLRPTDESYIRCRLALPVARAWSGRFWGFGNGGPGGGVNLPLGTAIAGDAGVHTDLGTSRGVFGKREVLRDFGWRATHLMTVSAKDLTAAYFGRQPDRCYFRGASTGGGQGFHEALRFPEDYDGVLAYVPANTRLPLHVYFAWNLRLQKDAQGRDVFSREEFAAVEQAALDWFADKDDPSVRGKFLTDTRYSPSVEKQILDLAKARVPTLAEGDKLERLHRMFEGPVLDGKPVHAGVPFSASLAGGAGNQWMLQWYLGPNRPLHTVTDAELVRWMKTWGPDCDACGEGVSRFFARGGKMIVVGGLEDSIVPYPSMVDWYERAAVECGGRENLARSCRLYLLPGRAHGQGRGCGDIRGDVAALVRWVETGTAPEAVQSPLRGGGVRTVEPWSGTWPAPGGRLETVAEAVSPDGRNAIRLRTKPLGYEVLRDGRTLVPFSPIGLKVDGVALEEGASAVSVADRATSGRLATPVYKKAFVDLTCNGKFVDFGTWGVALAARNDGVAWRFEMKTGGRVDDESASVSVPSEAKALVYKTDRFGCEERIPQVVRAKDVTTGRTERGEEKIYLPLVFETSGKTVAVTESDLRDYPCWYFERSEKDVARERGAETVTFKSIFAKWPKRIRRTGGEDETVRGRKEEVVEHEDYLVKAVAPPTHYIHESRELKAGEPLSVPLAPGGGFVARMREVNRNRP